MLTPFSALLAAAARSPGVLSVHVPEDWLQGRSLFGGLQAALAVEAMRTLVPGVPLRVLQTTFIGPVGGGLVTVSARVLRAGKNVTHVEARLGDDAVFIGIFGTSRPTVVDVPLAPPPGPTPQSPLRTLPFIPGVTPNFTQHYAATWRRGATPFTATPSPDPVLELAVRDEGPFTESHLIALADFIPPIALSYLRAPAPGSTVTWMLELLRHDFAAQPMSGWVIDGRLVAAKDGYTSQTVTVVAPDGVPAALSRQSMLVFS